MAGGDPGSIQPLAGFPLRKKLARFLRPGPFSRRLSLNPSGGQASWLRFAPVGLCAGFLSGLFGVGGGILMVPGLVYFAGLSQRRAHGTSLAATVLFASAGVAVYAYEGHVNLTYALIIIAGSATGVVAGTRLLQSAPTRGLQLGFSLLLGAAAGRFLGGIPVGRGAVDLTALRVAALVVLGVGVGILAGLLGIGGGILIVPGLVFFFEMSELLAKGTSLTVVLVTAAIGSCRNWKYRNVDARGALLTGCAGAASAFGGATLAGELDPRLSSVLIAVLMILIGARMLLGVVSSGRPTRKLQR